MEKDNKNLEEAVSSGEKLSKKELQKRKERKKKATTVIVWVCIGIVIAALVGLIVYKVATKAPDLDDVIVAQGEYYTVDASMVAYLTYTNYSNFASQYKDYLSMFGLDTTKSLHQQNYSDDKTWFDYFEEQAEEQLSDYVVFASIAKKNGLVISDEGKKEIDAYITNLTASATSANMPDLNTYLNNYLCPGVNEKTIRRTLELQQLAQQYYNQFKKECEESYTDADYSAYAEEHPELVLKYDYISYTFKPTYPEDADDAKKKELLDKSKSDAEELGKIIDKAKFEDAIYDLCLAELEDESKAEKKEDYIASHTTNNKYYSDDELGNWAKGAKVGEVKVLEDKSEDTVVSYTTYMLLSTPKIDEKKAMNVRHILFSGSGTSTIDALRVQAAGTLNDWKNGEATSETFAELAKKLSEDDGSASNGGLYTNVFDGMMLEQFNDWLFEDGRKAGDTGIVETDAGVHVMYCEGEGSLLCWQSGISSSMVAEDYEKKADENSAFKPTFDKEKIALIP